MGNFRPLPTKCWEKFLTHKGYTKTRTKGSHDQWTKRGSRTIPCWGSEKEIPAMHLRTSCRTMNIDLSVVYDWAMKNC